MTRDPAPLTLVYSCSGCSSAAQLANRLAVRLDRAGLAEMSCIAGVGGRVPSLVRHAERAARSGRIAVRCARRPRAGDERPARAPLLRRLRGHGSLPLRPEPGIPMNIETFDDLLQAARAQPQPQRLLFVFARAELPDDATPEQRLSHAAGEGGALVPAMCVDKSPDEVVGFAALVQESLAFAPDWAIVFAAAMSGRGGRPPSSAEAAEPLQRMVEALSAGTIGSCLAFDRQGRAVNLG